MLKSHWRTRLDNGRRRFDEAKVDAIHTDIKEIKNGPVYSLDQFITKKVAQMTGGMGAVAIIIMYAIEKGLF